MAIGDPGMTAFLATSVCFSLLFGIILSYIAYLLLRVYGRRVRNFRGQDIPSGYGLYIAAWAAALPLFLLTDRNTFHATHILKAYLLVIAAFGVLGFLDDAFGSHGAGGFAGHLRSLLRKGRVTTGLLKAVGGGAASLGAACMLNSAEVRPAPESTVIVLANAAIIALSANLINLLDLRPGRAAWAFILLWLVLVPAVWALEIGRHDVVLASGWEYAWLTLPAFGATAVLLPRDSRGLWIMGDSGSNVLGAILGFGAMLFLPLAARMAVLALLVAIHLYAERFSVSTAIESNRFLRAIDRRLGVR